MTRHPVGLLAVATTALPLDACRRCETRLLLPVPDMPCRSSRVDHLDLDGEDLGEEVSEDRQGDEPEADGNQHRTSPPLDLRSGRLDPLEGEFLRTGHGERRGEHKRDDHDRGEPKGRDSDLNAAGHKGLPGQTGQDRTRSTEPGRQVEEPERDEPCHGGVAAAAQLASG